MLQLPHLRLRFSWNHCGVHERLPYDPLINSPRSLPGCSRPCSPHVGTISSSPLPAFSDVTLRTIKLASLTARRPARSFHADDQALSNSLNCEKCLLTHLPGIFLFLNSSYNRHVIVPFINLPLNAGLYGVLFLIAASLLGVRLCTLSPNLDHLHITYSSSYLQSLAIVFFPSWGAIFNVPECINESNNSLSCRADKIVVIAKLSINGEATP